MIHAKLMRTPPHLPPTSPPPMLPPFLSPTSPPLPSLPDSCMIHGAATWEEFHFVTGQ